MFKIRMKGKIKSIHDVYSTRYENDNCAVLFLIYEDGRWKWIDGDFYEPYNEE